MFSKINEKHILILRKKITRIYFGSVKLLFKNFLNTNLINTRLRIYYADFSGKFQESNFSNIALNTVSNHNDLKNYP